MMIMMIVNTLTLYNKDVDDGGDDDEDDGSCGWYEVILLSFWI